MRALAALLLAAGLCAPALAQQVPNPMSRDVEKVYYPYDFGARCDATAQAGGGADDTAALNAMFDAIRTAAQPFRVAAAGKTCRVTGTINATSLRQVGDQNRSPSTIELRLYCATGGTPCIDALNTRFITWEHLYINGAATGSPSIGIQFGRSAGLASADMNVFNQPYITGTFTKTGVYNYAAEQTTIVSPFVSNAAATAGSYGWMEDACNSAPLTSAFTTAPAANTCASHNSTTFVGGWLTGDVPLFLSGTQGSKFINSYLYTTGNLCAAAIYQNGATYSRGLDLDLIVEINPVSFICLRSSTSSIKLQGLKLKSFVVPVTGSVFNTAAGITSVIARDLELNLSEVYPGLVLFSNPALWTVSGLSGFLSGDMTYNGLPPSLSGNLCLQNDASGIDKCIAYSRGVGWQGVDDILAYVIPRTVAQLAAAHPCATSAGSISMVSDALAPAWHAAVVGGGAVLTPVYCNGANWVAY